MLTQTTYEDANREAWTLNGIKTLQNAIELANIHHLEDYIFPWEWQQDKELQNIPKNNFSRNETRKLSVLKLSLKGLGYCLKTSLTELMQP